MIRKLARRMATVFGASSACVLFAAGAAHASDAYIEIEQQGYVYGNATWTENGDTLIVCDDYPDGYGVRGYIYRPNAGDPGNGTVLMKVSDPKYDSNCASVSTNISETITISIKVCNYAGAWVGDCSYKVIPR